MGILITLVTRFVPGLLPAFSALANPWIWLAFAAWTALIGVKAYGLGVEVTESAINSAKVAIIKKIEKVKEIVRIEHTKTEVQINTVFRYIEKESEHVASRAECNATAGWVRVHDAAASGSERIVGDVGDTTDTGIEEGRVLAEVILPNYKAFHQVANDLRACRAFVTGVAKATAE